MHIVPYTNVGTLSISLFSRQQPSAYIQIQVDRTGSVDVEISADSPIRRSQPTGRRTSGNSPLIARHLKALKISRRPGEAEGREKGPRERRQLRCFLARGQRSSVFSSSFVGRTLLCFTCLQFHLAASQCRISKWRKYLAPKREPVD